MVERKHVRIFPGELAALGLRSCDVEVFARLYKKTDEQAARDLIGLRFEGIEIAKRHNGHKPRSLGRVGPASTRRQVAADVFREYLGKP